MTRFYLKGFCGSRYSTLNPMKFHVPPEKNDVKMLGCEVNNCQL